MGQTEIVKSEDRQDHGQQNETKDKYRTHNTTLKTKAGVTRTLQKQGEFRWSGRLSNLIHGHVLCNAIYLENLSIQQFPLFLMEMECDHFDTYHILPFYYTLLQNINFSL